LIAGSEGFGARGSAADECLRLFFEVREVRARGERAWHRQVLEESDPERKLRREGEQEDERAYEAEHQQATAGQRPGRLRLRQPEPGVERRQQVDERERVRRDDEQCDQPECDQGDRVTCEGLLRPSRSPGQ